MAAKNYAVFGKILYALLFVAAVPALLVVWARLTEESVPLNAVHSLPVGLILAFGGAFLMISGMAAIYFYGRGLPMNAYPPARFVVEGVYGFLPHPIYTGFSMLSIGVSIAAGSASGLWLVSPTVILGCVALVQGYEKQATRERFGESAATKPLIRLPAKDALPPAAADRISVYVIALLPWLLFCLAAGFIETTAAVAAAPSFSETLSLESGFSRSDGRALIYQSRYLFIFLVPLIAKTTRALREFTVRGAVATAAALLLFIAFPYGAVVYIALQVAWILLAAKIYAETSNSWSNLFTGWALLVAAAGAGAGILTLPDVLRGALLFLLAVKIREIWARARSLTERVANSWTEWRFGQIRIISHGIYAGAGAFVALSIIGTLTGPAYVPSILIVTASGVLLSAISAQWIEGSSKLLRPYGWFGGMLGAIIGLFIAKLLGGSTLLLFAAFCAGAPWGQAGGRLRCLVQGCCHGREAPDEIGIRYVHPASRVCRLADLAGVPVHPTPLYSIIYNGVTAIVLTRIWLAHGSLALIVGVYFILTGLGRFVEESYRGEPQTPIFGNLRLYQLISILTIVGGILVTMADNSLTAPAPAPNWQAIFASAGFGVFVCLAFGVDFPNSNKRFARLT
jgi:protein-S-isoprenylcysteine O-methyltransferase Ste14